LATHPHQRTARLLAASAVLLVAAALSAAGLLSTGVAASADDNSGGIGITVTVAPTDANAGSGGSGGSGDSGGGSDGSTTPSESPSSGPVPGSTPKPGGGDSVGGIVFVSGLTSQYIWSPNPLRSAVELRLTVRNVSKTNFDSTARFWVTTTFGAKLSEANGIAVHALKPNETRVIRTTLGGLGQWTVLQAHATFNPPKVVEGTSLAPVTRDAFIVVPPVIVGGVGVGAACVFILLKSFLFPKLFGLAKVFV
jgi:hypothetical protein